MARPGIIAGITVLLGVTLSAQEWSTFTNRLDRFEVNLPGQPKVEEIKWPSEYGAIFPGRVYALEQNGSRDSITVIDYTEAERIHAARTNCTEADSLPIGVRCPSAARPQQRMSAWVHHARGGCREDV